MDIRPLFGRSSSHQLENIDLDLAGGDVALPVIEGDVSVHIDHADIAMSLADENIHLIDPVGQVDHTRIDASAGDDEARAAVRAASNDAIGILSGRRATRNVIDYVRTHGIDTLVLPRQFGRGPLGRRRHDRIAELAPCEVISVGGDGRFRAFASILVPVAAGPHTGLAAAVAGHIADECDAWIDILHVLPSDTTEMEREEAKERLTTIGERVGPANTVNPWVLAADDPAGAIIEQSAYYGLTVIGAPTSGRLKRFFHGSTSHEIRREADSLVIAAHAHHIGAT